MTIDSWGKFIDAVDDYIKMNEDNSYQFEPKRSDKIHLQRDIKEAIRNHRKKVAEREQQKQMSLDFTEQ